MFGHGPGASVPASGRAHCYASSPSRARRRSRSIVSRTCRATISSAAFFARDQSGQRRFPSSFRRCQACWCRVPSRHTCSNSAPTGTVVITVSSPQVASAPSSPCRSSLLTTRRVSHRSFSRISASVSRICRSISSRASASTSRVALATFSTCGKLRRARRYQSSERRHAHRRKNAPSTCALRWLRTLAHCSPKRSD